jgi:hypothetical protein
MQRTLLIIAAVVVILGIGAFAYFYFLTSSPGVAVAPEGSTSLPLAGQTAMNGSAATGSTTIPVISSPGTPVAISNRLIQISAGPVVPGAAIIDMKPTSASSSPTAVVNFIERQSGNVFTYAASTRTLTRVNNKTLPGIQSAAWLPDASTAFVRYLSGTDSSTINTYALAATTSQGFFLSQNLSDIAVSSAGIITIASGVNGSIGSLARIDGSHASTIFTTPLTALRIYFAGKSQYLAVTKPSSTLMGDAFLVSSSGHFSRIAGPHLGLTALPSPSGKQILVSYVENSALHMELVNTATGAVTALPVSTIAEKCVWAPDESSIYCGIPDSLATAAYPDDWYQGAVSFTDRLWNIHVADRYAQMVLDFSQANKGTLDAVGLAVDPAKTTLVFTNKTDGSLWSFSL